MKACAGGGEVITERKKISYLEADLKSEKSLASGGNGTFRRGRGRNWGPDGRVQPSSG